MIYTTNTKSNYYEVETRRGCRYRQVHYSQTPVRRNVGIPPSHFVIHEMFTPLGDRHAVHGSVETNEAIADKWEAFVAEHGTETPPSEEEIAAHKALLLEELKAELRKNSRTTLIWYLVIGATILALNLIARAR